jgi:hypothetical protein
MITVEFFRAKIRSNDLDFLLEEVLLGGDAEHVANHDLEHVRSTLSTKFGVPAGAIGVWVVGSAKLGFAITEKAGGPGF